MIAAAIMLVTVHSGPFVGESFVIPYGSYEACQAAIKAVSDTLDYDHSLLCTAIEENDND